MTYWKNKIKAEPDFELTESMCNRLVKGYATTEDGGAKIMFRWEICRLLPSERLQELIAHEMGHVYQHSIGKNHKNIERGDVEGFNDSPYKDHSLKKNALVELHADGMAKRWGFDTNLIEAFLLQNFHRRHGEYVERKKPKNKEWAYNKANADRFWSLVDFD